MNTKVFVLIHDCEGEKTVSVHKTLKGAKDTYKEVLTVYKNNGLDININASNDSELYEATDGGSTLFIDEKTLRD